LQLMVVTPEDVSKVHPCTAQYNQLAFQDDSNFMHYRSV